MIPEGWAYGAEVQIGGFAIQILRRKDSDLLTAFSDDLPGLLVPARNREELDERLPRAIKQLLEAHKQ
jgi:hypothetical protein